MQHIAQSVCGQDSTQDIEFRLFDYPATDEPATRGWEQWGSPVEDVSASGSRVMEMERCRAAAIPLHRNRMAEEMRRSFEAGREQGCREGRETEREAISAAAKASEMVRAENVSDAGR